MSQENIYGNGANTGLASFAEVAYFRSMKRPIFCLSVLER